MSKFIYHNKLTLSFVIKVKYIITSISRTLKISGHMGGGYLQVCWHSNQWPRNEHTMILDSGGIVLRYLLLAL